MKKVLIILVTATLLSVNAAVFADVYVHGYTRSNGTYVAPHYRSNPDGDSYDNYSSKGNVNPYTGEEGHRTPGYDEGERGSLHSRSYSDNFGNNNTGEDGF
ncbi:hypothetical protein [Candidiatus Paracoxiella cheracis]|uniref:hypothetical protein n=1 Tax=Candidiatus Paracoxiella cheracis TaxID=3405120 RepID=UPI003BF4C10D